MSDLELSEDTEVSVDVEEALEAVSSLMQERHPDVWGPHSIAYFGPESRAIMITGEIDEKLATCICSQVYKLSAEDPEGVIKVHINTPGGSAIDALSIYDTLQIVPNPIITIVQGGAFSAGVLLAMAGDVRLTTPNSMYFYHQPIMQMLNINSAHSFDAGHSFYKWSKQKVAEIIRKRAGISKRKWARDFDGVTDKYFDAEEAIELGIATDMLEYHTKPEIIFSEPEKAKEEE